eukprot:sb/3461760/
MSKKQDEFLSPLPPRPASKEGQVDVNTTPAFKCLNELLETGQVGTERIAQLKTKYLELHDRVKCAKEKETTLLQSAKRLNDQLGQQKYLLENTSEDLSGGDLTEVGQLRQTLLKHNNKLLQSEQRIVSLQFEIERLQEEVADKQVEVEKCPKPGLVETQKKELSKAVEELKVEVAQRSHEIRRLTEELNDKAKHTSYELKEIETCGEEQANLKVELVRCRSAPGHISKQVESLGKQLNDIQRKLEAQEELSKDLDDDTTKLSTKYSDLSKEELNLKHSIEVVRQQHEGLGREYDAGVRDLALVKEKEAALMGDKATFDLQLKHAQSEYKAQYELQARARDKDKELRTLQIAEKHLKITEDQQSLEKQRHENYKDELDSFNRESVKLQEKRKELQHEVENLKRTLVKQLNLTAAERQRIESSLSEERQLVLDLVEFRAALQEITRITSLKTIERDNKAREYLKAEMRFHKAREDMKAKQHAIEDAAKKTAEMQTRLREFAKMYNVIKNERNKCVNLIQTSTQRAGEMREKKKILHNEIEILQQAANHKDRKVKQEKRKYASIVVLRDNLQLELGKQRYLKERMREQEERKRLNIDRLNQIINMAEDEMVKLRKRYEAAVQERNDRGIHLIERNEEVCIFYEKVNIHDQLLREGAVSMQDKDENKRVLNLELRELQRQIDLLRKQVPEKANIENSLVESQIELTSTQERLYELEKKLESPENKGRVRLLKGQDHNPDKLEEDCEKLEERLAEQEQKLLEKELILEEEARLTERLSKKVELGQTDTLHLAKQVNEYQRKLQDTTRKMMALVSELSMNQAETMKLQQEAADKRASVEDGYRRLDMGLPPSDEADVEWQRMVREDEMKVARQMKKQQDVEEAEQYTVPGGITTTAEPRPNAYIPDDLSELPVPRPYGALAPFKPTEPGACMRHIRKPVVKPIEI